MTPTLTSRKLGANTRKKLSFPFVKTDSGRSTSKRPTETDDCTVRAMAIAAGIPYDQAHATLALAGRSDNSGANFGAIVSKVIVNGYRFENISFPAVKNKHRMRQAEFVRSYPKGRFILHTAHHVMACVDGKIYDTGHSYDERCIYNAWQLMPVAETEISDAELEQRWQRELALPIHELVERLIDSQRITQSEAELLKSAVNTAHSEIIATRFLSSE